MHLPRPLAVTFAAVALTGALAGCSDDTADPGAPDVVEPAGAEPGVDAADPGVDEEQDVSDAPAIDVEPSGD